MEGVLPNAEHCELWAAMETLSKGTRRGLRPNPLRAAVLPGWDSLEVVPWCPTARFLDAPTFALLKEHPLSGAGAYFIQEPGAMEAVEWLDPRPGDQVLDLCAAPGAKSTQIAERLAGQGWLLANDPVRGRASKLDALLARHGAANLSVYSMDPAALAEIYPRSFSRILVDAPCSGESLFAKRLDDRWDINEREVRDCARRQTQILEAARRMAAPGARLVYSTCTYARAENEDVVEAFLAAGEGWILKRASRRWPHRDGVPGGFCAWLEHEGEARAAQKSLADRPATAHGLLRHGWHRWDGELDIYAAAMAVPGNGAGPESIHGDWEVSEAAARAFLRGEALRSDGFSEQTTLGLGKFPSGSWVRVRFAGQPIGVGRKADDRLNNFVPKTLRSL
jgi:16S rRNA C967 or C1407 C5-methylase (RsmB/RsmF family)